MKKIVIILLGIFFLTGCVKVNDLTLDEISNYINENNVNINTYRKGYSFYMPKGFAIEKAGSNYVIFSTDSTNYYLYLDFISYRTGKKLEHSFNDDAYYKKEIDNNGNFGYIDIKLWKNNQYLIEIMYNYAKIEVMVDKDMMNKVLINSINILKSIQYNDAIIDELLESDSLDYTEEVFDMFKDALDNSNTLEHENDNIINEDKTEIMDTNDTDYLN